MATFLHAVSSVTLILLLTASGYLCAAMGWMGQPAKAFISKFLMTLAIPCMCVYGLTNNLTHDLLVGSAGFLLVPLICTSASFLLSWGLGRQLRPARGSVTRALVGQPRRL